MTTRLRPNKVSDVIPKELQAAINDLKRGDKVIQGSLSVLPGYDFWWFLEYGTGEFHEDASAAGMAGPVMGSSAHHAKLEPPDEVAGHEADGQAYEIEAGGDNYLVYMVNGQRRRRKSTIHPGIKPIGFVRTALFEAELFMQQDLEKLAARKNRLLTRKEVVDTVNYILQVLLGELRLLTPDDSDPDPYHEHRPHKPPLSAAWRVSKAQ
jgi:hypothetical protein